MRHSALFLICLLVSSAFTAEKQKPDVPQRVRSYRHLLNMLRARDAHYLTLNNSGGPELSGALAGPQSSDKLLGTALPMSNAPAGAGAGATADTPPSSATNVQVAGVDEADIVKNDGEYIYAVNRERVLLVKAFPDSALAITSTLSFASEFWPLEVFIDTNRLVVIGSSYRTEGVERAFYFSPGTVKAIVFDTTDKSKLVQLREVELDGSYLSSRKIGQSIYLVARKYPDFYFLPFIDVAGSGGTVGGSTGAGVRAARRKKINRNSGVIPALRDTVVSSKPQKIAPDDIFYLPGFTEPDYLLVAGFNLGNDSQAADVKVFVGAGQAVYASRENLYVADTKFPLFFGLPLAGGDAKQPEAPPLETTGIYRFSLDNGNVAFSARGEVPGSVANQFAMDERDGFFRVATTLNDWTNATTSNNVYVLDKDLAVAGKLEGLAPGERIFSTRFLGERCYVVTFRQVDPLFVISLADPHAPAVLGELKIPGFSDYLHPYDDTHILGFGKDAVNGLYQGMKIACFDVSDVSNPVQLHGVSIGDRGTSSELLYDHRALLFDRTKNLLAFPISVAQIKDKTVDMPAWTWGETIFNGAYVYDYTLENGFVFRAAISHQTPEQLANWDYSSLIRRLLYIDTNLYSVSESKIQVHDLGTLAQKAALELK